MSWKELQAGRVNRAMEILLNGWGNDAARVVAQIHNDPTIPRRFAELCLNDRYEESTSQSEARVIMGRNFFGNNEAGEHLGITYSKRVLRYMEEIPFSPATLKKCKDTHVLVAYFPMSYGSMCMATSKVALPRGQRLFHPDNPLTRSDRGAKENIGFPEWYLVRKSPVDNSLDKSWSFQKKVAFEDNDDLQPKPMVMAYAIIGHFLETGVRLFPRELVRTSKSCPGNSCVVVGKFGPEGLLITTKKNGVCSPEIGIASEVRPADI